MESEAVADYLQVIANHSLMKNVFCPILPAEHQVDLLSRQMQVAKKHPASHLPQMCSITRSPFSSVFSFLELATITQVLWTANRH